MTNSAAPLDDRASAACVGVFDSGVGGLSVLRALHRHLPRSRLLYVADSGYAPYGERDERYVIERSRVLTAHLLREGAQLIVVACNTATAAAVRALREEHPGVQFVGVEPGIKPAIALSRNGRIGVMATRGTLASDKFRQLVSSHAQGAQLHLQACAGLAHAIEAGDADSAEVLALVDRYTAPLREADVDTVVLGCTHYPFVAQHIQKALGAEVRLVDTADAVARRAQQLATSLQAATDAVPRQTARLWTTGDLSTLQSVAGRWLGFEAETQVLLPA
ncbi:glutamate racemase [Methylibium sp. Root1272]|uniref:glutamate racemase n=1 Tax=Methylibium sp. Root1272 TaxID=1736441 RepID=UPI0006F4976F|nr:glutamate racemase [Methylibium sp. Root1272]KQW66680.1 glutamate racemase [Methylibium sp. Root1272]